LLDISRDWAIINAKASVNLALVFDHGQPGDVDGGTRLASYMKALM
jgi:hypothetical protein